MQEVSQRVRHYPALTGTIECGMRKQEAGVVFDNNGQPCEAGLGVSRPVL